MWWCHSWILKCRGYLLKLSRYRHDYTPRDNTYRRCTWKLQGLPPKRNCHARMRRSTVSSQTPPTASLGPWIWSSPSMHQTQPFTYRYIYASDPIVAKYRKSIYTGQHFNVEFLCRFLLLFSTHPAQVIFHSQNSKQRPTNRSTTLLSSCSSSITPETSMSSAVAVCVHAIRKRSSISYG